MNIELEFEVGESVSIEVNQEMCGFGVNYPEDWNQQYLSNELNDYLISLINIIKRIRDDLGIPKNSYFILHLTKNGNYPANYVDKQNKIFYLYLPVKRITKNEIELRGKQQTLFHEMMHVKDVICDRFPSIGIIRERKGHCFHALINYLWGFSIDGRLEKMNKPSKGQQKALNQWLTVNLETQRLCGKQYINREQSKQFCDELWGKKITYGCLKLIAKKLMYT